VNDDPNYWLERFNGDSHLAWLVIGGMTKRRCPWCERELRPCNLNRHIAARHFRQMTIDDYDELGQPRRRRATA
jgi:hypothetical protein